MKKFAFKQVAAFALTLVLGVGLVPSAAASEALGDDVHTSAVGLAPGALLTRNIFWSTTFSDLRNERYFTYQPADGVRPMAVYGDKVLNKQTLSTMAAGLEAKGLRVVGGVNGDFFDMATGNTLGVLISDGILRSTAGGFHAVGFRENGTAFIGTPDISVTTTFLGSTLQVTNVNKTRTAPGDKTPGGIYLYTEDYSKTTQHTGPGVDVILTPVSTTVGNQVDVDLDVSGSDGLPATLPPSGPPEGIPTGVTDSASFEPNSVPTSADGVTEVTGTLTQSDKLTVGGRVTCTVDQVLQSTSSIEIPAGKMILTVNSANQEWLVTQLSALKSGDQVDINVTAADTRWAEAATAIGGFYRIVTGGQIGPHTDKNANPRTAIGIKADGSVVLYAIDGKQPGYSVGGSLAQVAQRMVELGCVDAVGLDGGGSTTMVATMPGNSAMELLNRPSDGNLRAVSTALFLVSNLKPTGTLDHFYVTPYDALLLAGASVPLTANAMDSSYYPMSYSGGVSWSIHNGDGTVSADGVFTAGGTPGPSSVTATGGGVTGDVGMTVVKKPDTVALSLADNGAPLTALSLEPSQSIALAASSTYKKLPLISQNVCYTWTVDPAVGTVDANGVLTAGTKTAIGSLTVSAAGVSATIPVAVAGHIKELESFEAGAGTFTGTDTTTVAPEVSADQVRFGLQSLKLGYDATAGVARAGMTYAIPTGEHYLALWVYGDNSGNTLTLSVSDAAGLTSDVVLTALDFTGWKQVTVELPANTAALSAVNVVFSGMAVPTGTIWLDQMTTSNENFTDSVAPAVKIVMKDAVLTASVSDNLDKKFDQKAITLTVDGKPHEFTWDAGKSTLTATLPSADAKLHRVTVTAVDQSGNLGRASVDRLPAAGGSAAVTGPFADMTTHWAAAYTTYLHDKGVVTGVAAPTGNLFNPDANITRGEFSLMVARWMGLDLNAYATVELPFADVKSIPNWALNGIKAMYAEGIIKGSLDNGSLVSRATATISRAEAMTILGRIQPKGYEIKALTFSDTATVPAWSTRYVQSLVGQGVVAGFENQLRPNNPVKRAEVAKMLYTIL